MDYFKIIGKNNGNFPYHIGINSLAETGETFNPDPRCGPGGLYFTTLKYILAFLEYGDRLCRVRIPDGAQVVRVGDKWKADQIEIVDVQPLDLEWLIAQGADVHANKDDVLRWSAKNGYLEMVECLLKHGADVHACGNAPLRWSADSGHTEIVECLLKHGANLHIDEDIPLCWSAQNGHLAVVECLLAHGADVHAKNNLALQLSTTNGHTAVVRCLLKHSHNKNDFR